MTLVDRREFLHTAALGLASLGMEPVRTLEPIGTRGQAVQQHVLIVGAGMAGLTAGLELTEAGHDVTILEARTRPGGRVYTLRAPFADGLYAETGAARIPESHDLTLRYAERMGLETAAFSPGTPGRIVAGDRVLRQPGFRMSDFGLPFTDEERNIGLEGLASHYLADVLEEIGDPRSEGWPGPHLERYDAVTGAAFLRERGASEATIAFLDSGGGVLERYSMLELSMQVRLGAFDPMVRIPGGTDRLPRAMAERLSSSIVYGTPVVRIEQDPDSVTAVTGGPHELRRFDADRMVLTIPFSVLRDVELAPHSPPRRCGRSASSPTRTSPASICRSGVASGATRG